MKNRHTQTSPLKPDPQDPPLSNQTLRILPSQTRSSGSSKLQERLSKGQEKITSQHSHGRPRKSTGGTYRKRLEAESPKAVVAAHWPQPLEWTVSERQKDCEVRLSLGSDIPTSCPISREHHRLKRTCTPASRQHCSLPVAKTGSLRNPRRDITPQTRCPLTSGTPFLTPEN